MPKYPSISNQELHNKLIQSNQLIKSQRTKYAINNNAQEHIMRIPMKEGYEAESYSLTPEAYAVLEPIYSQQVTKTGVAISTEKLADVLFDSVLRKEKHKALID